MNKKRMLLLFIITFILLNLFTGCFKQKEPEELKIGKYVMQDTELEGISWVLLEKDNKFRFNRQVFLSYLPVGTYSIEGNKLTLYVNENESYVFTIEKDKLIFESSNFDDDSVKKGAVFKLSDKE